MIHGWRVAFYAVVQNLTSLGFAPLCSTIKLSRRVTMPKVELSVFDMLNNDESEVGSERSLVHEAHVAFSVEEKGSNFMLNDIELEVDAMMQDMDVPLGGNPSQFLVDITDSHGNWKPNLSTFSDDMQLDSHYRNSKCSFGDTDISYNIGREDIWDAKVSYLDDGFPHEREDDIS
ncbi:hypothetical protein ERO13_D01G148301v2 [Gossypium hirsutum]|nr:hypothetical protein ERO13_D01G148301v2 [Gossypium hirsutum]